MRVEFPPLKHHQAPNLSYSLKYTVIPILEDKEYILGFLVNTRNKKMYFSKKVIYPK